MNYYTRCPIKWIWTADCRGFDRRVWQHSVVEIGHGIISTRDFAEKKNGLCELKRNIAEFSPRKFAFENFCLGSEHEKRAFFLGWSVYVGQWPIFYCPMILLHIMKTIWWRNVVLGIMDQCDTKIDFLNICGSVTYILWSIDFAIYHCHRLKLFVYIKKWHRLGVFVPLQALALVEIEFV